MDDNNGQIIKQNKFNHIDRLQYDLRGNVKKLTNFIPECTINLRCEKNFLTIKHWKKTKNTISALSLPQKLGDF